jgi:concentrative nucleoside transporter, CNT family
MSESAVVQDPILQRHASAVPRESLSDKDEKSVHNAKTEPNVTDLETPANAEDSENAGQRSWYRTLILVGLAVLILGWWISATVLKATRHRWYVIALAICNFHATLELMPPPGLFRQSLPGCVSCFHSKRKSDLNAGVKFFLGLIFFQFVPSKLFFEPIGAVWETAVARPFRGLPYHVRLGMGFLCLLGIIFGSAFGFPIPKVCMKYLTCLSRSLI